MEIKEFKVVIPCGMEIDKKNSTFECIKFKQKDKRVKTWDDLKEVSGYYIEDDSSITGTKSEYIESIDKNVAATEKHCKMMLAIAQISQLIPYYGGEITDEEWEDPNLFKHTIIREYGDTSNEYDFTEYHFLAFHTEYQRDEFLKNNEQLVKDYLML